MTVPASDERNAVLDAERAVNEHYRRLIAERIRRTQAIAKEITLAASQQWTTSSLPRPGVDPGARSGLIGRVALEEGHPWSDVLGATFYVAGWRIEEGDFETVNWAAPVASLFFKGRDAKVEPAPSLLGRRSFVLYLDDIIDYYDQCEDGAADPFADRARTLHIPTAPTRRPRLRVADDRQVPAAPDMRPEEGRAREGDDPERLIDDDRRRDREPAAVPPATRLPNGLRAEDALFQVMRLPKSGRMGTVLPTMQPDQYQLVSWSGQEPLIVQGQPGTGKTVIAAHRAVYLTSEERESEAGQRRITRMAIVGPSDRYVEHVWPLVAELKEANVEIRVLSLPMFLRGIAGLRQAPKPSTVGWIESSWDLGRVIDRFVRSLPQRPAPNVAVRERVRHVIEQLTSAGTEQVAETDIREWLQALAPWPTLTSEERYLPMLATVALALDPRAAREPVDHLIVDEAQDVRQIEWRILVKRLLAPHGQVSLFGDINQRRSDWTASSWETLAHDLELTDDTGRAPVVELANGYRSTRQILRFANRLLPRGAREERALRDGPEPHVQRVARPERTRTTADVAADLAARHDGLVAVISVEPRSLAAEFRTRGWSRGRQRDSWRREDLDLNVIVLHPDQARGLEFDAAVVVEPVDFPKNVGRFGVLYTSLTRANKELAVVHSAGLPRDLRG